MYERIHCFSRLRLPYLVELLAFGLLGSQSCATADDGIKISLLAVPEVDVVPVVEGVDGLGEVEPVPLEELDDEDDPDDVPDELPEELVLELLPEAAEAAAVSDPPPPQASSAMAAALPIASCMNLRTCSDVLFSVFISNPPFSERNYSPKWHPEIQLRKFLPASAPRLAARPVAKQAVSR